MPLDNLQNGLAHGDSLYRAARRLGVSPDDLLDFSANINPFGPPPAAATLPASEWRRTRAYPDTHDCIELLSKRCSVDPERLVLGNGSAALIFAAARAISPARALILEPAFCEYRRALRAIGCDPHTHILDEGHGFRPDIDELCDLIKTKRIDLVFLNNPHNPSGSCVPVREVLELADRTAATGCVVVLDEAFVDFASGSAPLAEATERPNLISIRSLTKFFSIPGLRIGYAACNDRLARRIREQIEAWPVSSVALWAAHVILSDSAYEARVRAELQMARSHFRDALEQTGLTVFPSCANFLLVKLRHGAGSALADLLERYSILIRRCNTFVGLDDSFLRLAVRSDTDNAKLVSLMAELLSEQS